MFKNHKIAMKICYLSTIITWAIIGEVMIFERKSTTVFLECYDNNKVGFAQAIIGLNIFFICLSFFVTVFESENKFQYIIAFLINAILINSFMALAILKGNFDYCMWYMVAGFVITIMIEIGKKLIECRKNEKERENDDIQES